MESQSNCLFITYVEKEGPFLKVWGQTDKNTSLYVEQFLHSAAQQFDNGIGIPQPESLHVGILCCAKYKDNKYYRARITNLSFLHNRYVEVSFLDCGQRDLVPVNNIRSLEGFDNAFVSIQPQATSFLLAEAVSPRGEWHDSYLEEISKEIRYSEVNFTIIAQVTKHYLVRLFVGINDLAILLISKGLMRHTSLTTQEAVLLSMMPRTTPLAQPALQPNIVSYKAFTLEPGSQYEVYVSYVTDGPCNFSVQLKQSEEVLAKLMKDINSMNLTPLEEIPPIPGTVCLARCVEDGHICRAVVTSEVDSQYKVFYVDFGNFEVNSVDNLYEIPFKYVIPKVMAIRFGLSGVEKSTVTLEMQCAFKQFVDNRLMHMKVMPMTTRTSLPRCELWDPETQTSAYDIVTQAAASGYPEHISLNRGFSQAVKISYVFSCNRLYVQLKSKQDDLLRLMLDIQNICQETEALSTASIKVGMPCYALFEADGQWYRSQIVEVLLGDQVKVQYVDYGNEETVVSNLLKPMEGKQLTVLRPQAIECCLNGYQNMEPDLERDNLLEELILEQEFTMKVIEMQGMKALIELIDGANYNVASLLLDKIATTRSQVSPMLVQAGNKIEHRKSSYPKEQSGFKPEEKKERSRNNTDPRDSNENSTWRQSDRNFNKVFDRNKREDDLNDSTESERSHTSFKNRNENNSRSSEGSGFRQNTRGFNNNRNQDRQNFGDKNRWDSSDKQASSPQDDSDGARKRGGFQPRGNDNEDHWGSSGDGARKRGGFQPRDNHNEDNWGSGGDGGRKGGVFQSRDNDNEDNWGSSGDGGRKRGGFQSRQNNEDWGDRGSDTGKRRGGFQHRDNNERRGNWNDNRDERKPFHKKQDDWSNAKDDDAWRGGGDTKTDGWGGGKERDNFRKPRERFDGGEGNNFRKPRFEGGDRDRKPRETFDGFRKKPDFRRETSELSSSGSEKSFRKGGFKGDKNSSRFTPRDNFRNKFESPPKADDAWGVDSMNTSTVIDAAPSTAKFPVLSVDHTEANVIISWFHNPAHFYCQLEAAQTEFRTMMENIQLAYKDRSPSSNLTVDTPVIALFPEDKVLYRARIVQVSGSKFEVYYVDFGNLSLVDKVWPIEKRFIEMPAQAVSCKLDGVRAPTDSWADAAKFSAYFNKKQFACRFLATEDDRVAVQLAHEGEDIASALLRDGLAEPLAPALPPELAFLIGQQFRALLLSVNSLADFIMSLQSGIILNCSVFNLQASTETWENNLKANLNQILIVYVDDMKDDRLEVTLYDQTGSKIKLIDNDAEAFETVELLCPYTVLYPTLSGDVVHTEENIAYVQPSDCAAAVEAFLNSAYELYENSTLESPIQPVEGFVYAVRSSDTNWYRARVVSATEQQIKVNFLDYGNSEDVDAGAFRELTAEFMEIPIMCVPVTLNVPAEHLIGQTVTLDITFTETGISATIREEQIEFSQPEPQPTDNTEPLTEPPQTSGVKVIISHVDSPSDFYLQLSEAATAIDELQAQLQDQITEMPDMETPAVGVLCAAPFSLDQCWYRAQVLDADADITTVRFVDFGNTDVLDNQTTKVKTLPPNLLALEVYATRSRLRVKPIEEEWSTAASERFDELIAVESLTAEFIDQDEKVNYVELFSAGANVKELLLQENLALLDEDQQEVKNNLGFVSHLNSPSEFWMQMENCVEELEWIAEQLSGAEAFPELEELAPGTLCAALYPDDQMWYRARILSNTVAGIEVLFVDYGNSCMSCSLKELPEDLVMVQPLAQKSSLQKPEGLISWSPEMAEKFSEISADGQTTFGVKKLSTGETTTVELTLEGADVSKLLLPEVVEVRLKSVNGLDDLILIQGEDELETSFRLQQVPEVPWRENASAKLTELSKGGNAIFQAEFTHENTIKLYLNYNDIRQDLIITRTPTTSPIKTPRIHSTNVTDTENVQNYINDIMEDIITQSTDDQAEAAAESVLNDIVARSTKDETSPDKPITGKVSSELESPAKSLASTGDIETFDSLDAVESPSKATMSTEAAGSQLDNSTLSSDPAESPSNSTISTEAAGSQPDNSILSSIESHSQAAAAESPAKSSVSADDELPDVATIVNGDNNLPIH